MEEASTHCVMKGRNNPGDHCVQLRWCFQCHSGFHLSCGPEKSVAFADYNWGKTFWCKHCALTRPPPLLQITDQVRLPLTKVFRRPKYESAQMEARLKQKDLEREAEEAETALYVNLPLHVPMVEDEYASFGWTPTAVESLQSSEVHHPGNRRQNGLSDLGKMVLELDEVEE